MKKIFRYVNTGVLTAILLAVGAVAGLAQDPCEDGEGMSKVGDEFRRLYPLKDMANRKLTIETGKRFLEKYGACEGAQELAVYLKGAIPLLEDSYKKAEEAQARDKMITRFNAAMNSKNFTEMYAAGKELLAKYPDEFRDVELALGTVGFDELYNNQNSKFNAETIMYAKMSITDLEAGKTFSKNFGVPTNYDYNSKDNALGWMNYVVGYITSVGQKNNKEALPYLYKATQAKSDTAKNPVPYQLIGQYYFDELNKLTTEIKAMADAQSSDDTAEVAQQKVDAIKAKVALINGTSERAMDAFARAYTYGTAKAYKETMYKNLQEAYHVRFAKSEGLDAWIAGAVKQSMPNPLTPVTPIGDSEPSTTTSSTSKTAPTSDVKPVAPAGSKPTPSTVAKPAVGVKPQAVKKPVVKRKGV